MRLINEALQAGWLPNAANATPRLNEFIADYRQAEQALQPIAPSGAEDAHEGRDARLAVRGSYTTLGDEVPRGTIRFLGGPGSRAYEGASGRLELARNFARDDNPLTARVYVNRVWHYLFGAGIVRTVDDFGHLGETPSHPELLDWLAKRFMAEGWSTKQLIRMLVTSSAWRQASTRIRRDHRGSENRSGITCPCGASAETVRDAILAASGRLDPALYGPPINPHRVAGTQPSASLPDRSTAMGAAACTRR